MPKSNVSWQPSASLNHLRMRATMFARIRDFFAKRNILEVETPLLSHHTVTDLHVTGIPALFKSHAGIQQTVYLQTSPEYAMKRLLAAGSGPIYQLCKAFRQSDLGELHNPEFTMLEWYRPGFDHHALMDEMDCFLQEILQTKTAVRLTYAGLFKQHVGLCPHSATVTELAECAQQNKINFSSHLSKDEWLDVIMTHVIEPKMGNENPVFIYDFPASKAALAKIHDGVASRFEVYFKGIELANGFHELTDANEQRARFEKEAIEKNVAIDEFFLAALTHGLPDCAGVALGVDRLIMLALNCHSVRDVMSFDFVRA